MIIVIAGPTAVGKTLLSEKLAKKYNGIIINADAMQVYRKLNIGTAKVTKEEMEDVPHYLFDIKNPDEEYSMYDYQIDARNIIDKNLDKSIILVGGTGLYIKAALFNYELEKRSIKNNYEGYTNEELYNMLKERHMEENVHVNNRNRLISYLNKSPNNNLKNELLYKDVYFIGLTTNRENLYNRINKRVDIMIENGLIEEVKDLYEKYGKVKSLNTGIGYKEIIEYLDNHITKEEAINLIKTRSRHYAKRQYTWFNNQMNLKYFNTNYENFEKTIEEVTNYIENNN